MIIRTTDFQKSLVTLFVMVMVMFGFTSSGFGGTRDDVLAGEHETLEQKKPSKIVQEPDRGKAGADQKRPTLKLPEVVIKGDRQYKVTAEKKDLLGLDPMKGTKPIPADLAKVDMPGLEEEKDLPQARTITAKNYLMALELRGGLYKQAGAQLVAGFEKNAFDCILKAEYGTGHYPEAYGMEPMDQYAQAALETSYKLTSDWLIQAALETIGSTHSHPAESGIWGVLDWTEKAYGQVIVHNKVNLSKTSTLGIKGVLGYLRQRPSENRTSGNNVSGEVDFEMEIPFLTKNDLHLTAKATWQKQMMQLQSLVADQGVSETMSAVDVRTSFQPFSSLNLDIGVKLDQFSGALDTRTSEIVGGLSIQLPWYATLYGRIDAGLKWEPVSVWSFQHPRLTIQSLPRPQENEQYYKVGWRQGIVEKISIDLAWQKEDSNYAFYWHDADVNGLFAYSNLPGASMETLSADIEIYPEKWMAIVLKYVFRQPKVDGGYNWPNVSEHEGGCDVTLNFKPVTVKTSYRYIGARYNDLLATSADLEPAHLLSLETNVSLSSWYDVFILLDNCLGYTWQPWLNYRGRGFNGQVGMRFSF